MDKFGNKTKLKFVSLVKQIEGALARGYQEAEIIDVVIRAMVPDMQLNVSWKLFATSTCQNYAAFCGHTSQEKSATELYQHLTINVLLPQPPTKVLKVS